MRFALLGPLAVDDGAGGATAPGGPRLRILLAALLLHANAPVSSERLAEAVWDGEPSSAAAETLRSYVRRLRRALGPRAGARIVARDPGYLIRLEDTELDLLEFEKLCGEAAAALRDERWSQASATATQALELWRGAPLLDVPSRLLRDGSVPRLEQLRLQALEDRAEADLRLGRHDRLVPQLRDLTTQHPLRERFHAQRMVALYRCGRQAEALAAYQDARRALVDELGIEPGPELRRLHVRILAGDADLLEPPPADAPPGPIPAALPLPVPRQLPAAVRHFTGRHAELDTLLTLPEDAESAAGGGGTVVISAIDGMAGIGKTTLAVHAAHRLADRYPDGQLFLDLHGYTQGFEPRTPGEALEAFLRALGVPMQQIPQDLEQRAALYRQRLRDTRTLILLDNATDEAQVRPLLPGGAGCLVLITSRRRLKGLDDAYPLPLGVLPAADAIALLHTVAGRGAAALDGTVLNEKNTVLDEKDPVLDEKNPVLSEIAELCGRLPLALRIAAALLRHRPSWSPHHLASLLRDQQRRVSALYDGERDLGAVFDLSYRTLGERHQRAFRRLGLVPGPDFDSYAAAALIETDPVTATRLLEDLVDHNLLIQHLPGRYRLHDLIRLHAHSLADRDPVPETSSAIARLLDCYQHTAGRADALITRCPRPALPGSVPEHAPVLPDADAAWAWLRTERPNLLAALHQATTGAYSNGPDYGRIVALTAGMAALLHNDGPWNVAITLQTAAATAARHLGDKLHQAYALSDLAAVTVFTGDYPSAVRDQREALSLFQLLGDLSGQAHALTELGRVHGLLGENQEATRCLQAALELRNDPGERSGRATALTLAGQVRRATGDYTGAARDLQEALYLFRALGERNGQATALTYLGDVRRATGDYAGAARDQQEALDLFRVLGNRNGQAHALTWLGDVRRTIGDYGGAVRDLKEALELFRLMGGRNGQAIALTWLGAVRRASGDPSGAARDLETALELFRQIGARNNEVVALNHYAAAVAAGGDQPRALSLYQQALHLARDLNKNDEQALALEGVGECHVHTGDTETGVVHLKQALDIFQRLSMTPDTDRVQARITELAGAAART